jgi:Protein of unknown function (DUF3485)
MNRQKWILFALALVMIGGTAASLTRVKAGLKLGQPGIQAAAIPDSLRLDISLPERVLYYNSTNISMDPGAREGLPHDTSFAERVYASPTNSADQLVMMVVLMGTDRTSIHKPQFCLQGAGWDFDDHDSKTDVIRIQSPHPYDLPVTKMMMTRSEKTANGENVVVSGMYVYWFVADGQLTGSHFTRMWSSATHLLRTGELQRWAYVGCLSACQSGDEDAMYDRMKKFIAASVPEFQKTTGPEVTTGTPAQTASR